MRGASRRPRPEAASLGATARRIGTVAAVAFLAGTAFHAVAVADRATTATATPEARAMADTDAQAVTPNTGPTATVDGAPAGFARTEHGAVAAAASYVTTGENLLDMDPLSAERAIRQMAAETTADQQALSMLGDLRRVREVLRSGTGPIIYRQACLAARVERFDRDEARVSIWNVGILSREGVASPQAGWKTSVFELIWERGDWRIRSEIVTPGPAPSIDASAVPATSAQLAAQLAGFIPLLSVARAEESER